MFEKPRETAKTRWVAPILLVLGVTKLLALSQLVSLASELGSSAPHLFYPVVLGGLSATLCFLGAAQMRRRREMGYLLALSLALVHLPTWLFPVSIAIFWCMLPDELTRMILRAFQQEGDGTPSTSSRDGTPPA